MAKKKLFQSANFKRDYVAAMAIGLFIIMVISELVVAVSIPIAINHTSLFAEHGTRQRMVNDFDALRHNCNINNEKNPIGKVADMERKLIRNDLDIISSHLREYFQHMPMDEVDNVTTVIRSYSAIINKLNTPNSAPYCQIKNLDLSKISKRIEKKLDSAERAGNNKK